MFEGQFYIRLILNVIVGIMFAYALYKMAQHNNQETMPLSHKAMHVFGWIFIGLSVLCLCICIYYLTLVDFPQQLRGPFIGPNTIIRSTSAVFYWGYPTLIQNSTLTMALATFDFLGIGAYFLYFKSSHSKWWKKVLKFFVVLLLYAFMASATNFHYFDFPEFISPILYFILWVVIVNRKDMPIQSDRNGIEFVKEEQLDILAKSFSGVSIDDSVVCLSSEEASNENQGTIVDKATPCPPLGEEKVDTVPTQPDMQFCRHCGKKIEADSSFCKYCGNSLNVKSNLNLIPLAFAKCKGLLSNILQRRYDINLNKNNYIDRSTQRFNFSFKWKIFLAIFTLILLSILIGWFILLRYDKEKGLGDSYEITIVCSSIGFVFMLLTWLFGIKQEKLYSRWRKLLFWFCVIIAVSGAVIAGACIIDTTCSYRFEEAKRIYRNNKALESMDTVVLNQELNRRFEYIWDATKGHKGDSYYSIEYFISNDTKYFEILNKEAQQNNGVAQGILGEYYFSTGIHQIRGSQNELGYITDDNLYSKGQGNLERAFYWWKKASENLDPRGLYRMGNCYARIIEIDGVNKDLNQAYTYWTKASEKGYGMAYKRLGDLFGTWNYLDGVYVEISNDSKKGVDNLGSDENPSFSKPYPLPPEWKHDIAIARSYWEKAVECGGDASEEARKCLEKVYPEEK